MDENNPGTAAAPNDGCTPLNPLCRVNTVTSLPECVCKDDGTGKCDAATANQCSDTSAGTCNCGSNPACTTGSPGSTIPACLLPGGGTPTDNIASESPTCQVNHLSYNSRLRN